jgi:hypothetical protein
MPQRIGERLFSLMRFRDGQWSLAFGGREDLERAVLEHSDPGEAELAQLCAFFVGVPEVRPVAVVILEVLESVKDRFTFIDAFRSGNDSATSPKCTAN